MHDDPLTPLGTRLRHELRGATGPSPDMEPLHRRRSQRRVRAVAGAGVLAVVALIALPQLLGGPAGPTIDPVAPTEEPAPPDEPLDGSEVGELDLDIAVPVRLLAVRFNNPSLATFDLDTGRVEHYPPGSHGLSGDAISGALVTPDGAVVVWQDDTIRMFTDRLDEPDFAYTPDEMIKPAGSAPAFRVLPTADGQALWVVQIGSCCSDEVDGLAELVDLQTGELRTSVELPPNAFPAASLGEDLLLNTEDLRLAGSDSDAGWVTDPESLRVLRLTPDGQLSDLSDGHAVASSAHTALIRSCRMGNTGDGCDLDLLDTTTGERHPVAPASEGSLGTAAGPAVPGDFTPWDVVAPDGRILVTSATHDGIGNKADASRLLVLDPDTAELTEIARYDGPTPPAAWDRAGRYIVVADDRHLTIIDPDDGATISLDDVVPDDHYVVGIG